VEIVNQQLERFPIIALPLASLVELSPQELQHLIKEFSETPGVSNPAIVVVVTSQLGVQSLKQIRPSAILVFLTPLVDFL